MKNIVEKIIQKRNPDFKFDENVSVAVLLSLLIIKLLSLIRAQKLWLHAKKPNKIFLGKRVQFFNIRNMHFGKWVQIGDYAYLSALGKGRLTLGNNVTIGSFSKIIISTSFNNLGKFIEIGNNVGIGDFAHLGGAGGLKIGDDSIIGSNLSCHPENHIFDHINELIRKQGVTREGISIGKNCWIGAKVTILDGVEIGDNCIVAAGAVLTKSFPDNSVIGGVPAKIIKMRV